MNSKVLLFALLLGGAAICSQAQPDDFPGGGPGGGMGGPGDMMGGPGGDMPDMSGGNNAGGSSRSSSGANDIVNRNPSSRRSVSRVTLAAPKANDMAQKTLRLNFRNADLEQVLNYLSDAAGFVIILETQVTGKVDVWSNQPVTQDEAISLLNTVLNKNGYAVIQEDKFLTVVNKDDARYQDIPIKQGNNPTEIPKNTQIVTQIIPVRSLTASQLTKDLSPLLMGSTVTANETANALVMTDTQINIRRVAEIIKALDSVSTSMNSIKVFPLTYADSKSVVSILKELFPSQDSTSAGGATAGGGRGGRGGGMGGMMGMMFGGASTASASSSAQKASTRIVIVADENGNSVIASAPEDILPAIDEVIKDIDVNVDDESEVEVFHLHNADPTEMVALLTSLFPDESSTSSSSSSGFGGRMGGMGGMGGMMGMGNNRSSSSSKSDRALRKGRVLSVADQRTASVLVSADKSLMPNISQIITKLDADGSKKMKAYVYNLENANVTDVKTVLSDLFQSSSSRNNSSSTTDPFTSRQSTMWQQANQSTSSSTLGTSTSSTGR